MKVCANVEWVEVEVLRTFAPCGIARRKLRQVALRLRSNFGATTPKHQGKPGIHQGPEDEARHHYRRPCTVCGTFVRVVRRQVRDAILSGRYFDAANDSRYFADSRETAALTSSHSGYDVGGMNWVIRIRMRPVAGCVRQYVLAAPCQPSSP